MKPIIKLISLTSKIDKRGKLYEVTRAIPSFKHMFVATINPGFSRGNHFHKRKTEWILAMDGKVEVVLIDALTKEESRVILDARNSQMLEIAPNLLVRVFNPTPMKATILAIFDEVFDPSDPDVWNLTF